MCDLVSLESRRAEERQNKLSQALEAKRRLVTSLELQLETANLQVQLAQAEQDLAKANQDLERSQESKFSFKKARDKCFHARGHAQSLEKERAKALTAPFAVINPLPKDESFAFAAAFFLKIPVSLLDYAKSVYTAQSLLSPIDKKGACSSTTWTSHFNSYGGTFTAPTQDVVNFYPVGLQVPFHFGPGNVTQISSASELMWYPDYPSAIHYPSNPFSVSDLKIHALFRQPFAQKFAHLQWMNDYPLGVGSMDSNARHNVVFGKQNLKPIGFSKEGFLSLGNLRAFGRTQFRHIITLIKEQSVPFGHTIVKTLLFQAVHQVGEISSDSIFKWRAGLHEEGEMDALVEAMDEMVSCLEHSPRDHASFLSLASTALYFGQWSDSMHAVGRRFFDIAYAWAQDVKSRCDMCPITSPSYGELRGKLCLMTGYALFCISRLTWTETDLESYVSLLFQFYSGLGYANGVAPDLQTQIHEIKSICCIETSRRLNDVQRLLGKDSSSLTR